MSKDRVIKRVASSEFATVVQDLRLARLIVDVLAGASPSMQQLLLPSALATEETVARVMWKFATDVAERRGDISFVLSSVGDSAIFILESEPGAGPNNNGPEHHDLELLALTPRGEA